MNDRSAVSGVSSSPAAIEERLKRLEEHLRQENPILLQIVKSFRQLDRIAYRLRLLDRGQSFATLVPWWPLISVVGTFSSGKSTFINQYLGEKLQRTGNQAVDDKFTVICFSSEGESRTLPGLALDADPRFPFYQISRDIEQVAAGEGSRVDAYLQLKTCPSQSLRGKILIDSPGFDADEQRTSVLRITDHILSLSDLVLVLFDARHPEPGAMQDTLEHLVAKTIKRPDSNKFLYILNQVDSTAREDNPEEVFAAWQRALAQKGLTAGRFYRIYDPEAASIENEEVERRFTTKRDADMADIQSRIEQVEVERVYRIVGILEKTAKAIEGNLVPRIRAAKSQWRLKVMWLDGLAFGLIGAAAVAGTYSAGYWQGLRFAPPWLASFSDRPALVGIVLAAIGALALYLHFFLRGVATRLIVRKLRREEREAERRDWVIRAFRHSTRPWRPLLLENPAGWGRFTRRRLARILTDADRYVQTLNNRFASPSGDRTRLDVASSERVRASEPDAVGDAADEAAPDRPDPKKASLGAAITDT